MRISSITLRNYKPIKLLSISNLGNTVVIAGANGSGKTRLKQAIVQTLQGSPQMDITIHATREEEKDARYFNGDSIAVTQGQQNQVLTNYINSRKYGAGRYVGSLVQIDSDRSVQALKFTQVNWLGGDPDDAESAGNFYFNPFTNRWQDFMNYIHQKSAARDKKLAEVVKKKPELAGALILERNPDPLKKYQNIFSSILPGKSLLPIDPASPKQFHYSDESGQRLPFNTLSSGEQEVIKVLFDVARKEIRHSVIIVDEPELHLHPTLSFKLIEALKSVGDHTNQFIFLTHSSDLISTYYSTGDVYFIDQNADGHNQAHRLSDLGHEHQEVAALIGQNLGLFAVGRKLAFVEGEDSSIDRLTYQKIARREDGDIRVIPSGSVLNILALNNIEAQIRKAIFGINLYMIRDRDGLTEEQVQALEANGRIRCLKRRHLENYFLDPEHLFLVAEKLYLTAGKEYLTSDYIAEETRKIAESSLMFNLYQNTKEYLVVNYSIPLPVVRGIDRKSDDEVRSEIVSSVAIGRDKLLVQLADEAIQQWIQAEEQRLRAMIADGRWIKEFQGKYLFSRVCGEVLKAEPIKVRQAYVDFALEERPELFEDVSELFRRM
ncbi:MAG: AAA family ATPase [Candidatus Thiodiazotropha endolucinida]